MKFNNQNFYLHESSYIDRNVKVGEGTKIWHFSHILDNCIIGKNCTIGQNVMIGPNVVIGNNVKIQNNVSIYDGVEVHDDVFLGPSCVFTNVINPRSGINRKDEFKKTILEKGATVGANATIICGNQLGKFSFVGAGSTVTSSIRDYELVYGNPAKHQGWMSENGVKLVKANQKNETNELLQCPISEEFYELSNGKILKK